VQCKRLATLAPRCEWRWSSRRRPGTHRLSHYIYGGFVGRRDLFYTTVCLVCLPCSPVSPTVIVQNTPHPAQHFTTRRVAILLRATGCIKPWSHRPTRRDSTQQNCFVEFTNCSWWWGRQFVRLFVCTLSVFIRLGVAYAHKWIEAKIKIKETAIILACSIVSSRLDYCNAVLYGTTSKNADRLQRVQNSVGRVVCSVPYRSSSQPLRKALHWLLIEQPIQYKSALMTYNVRLHRQPQYLPEVINDYQSACSISAIFNQCFINSPIVYNFNSCSRFSRSSPTNMESTNSVACWKDTYSTSSSDRHDNRASPYRPHFRRRIMAPLINNIDIDINYYAIVTVIRRQF